jgi:hypothetical protein
VVAIAADRFLKHGALHVAAEGDVLDVEQFLDEQEAQAIALVVDVRIVRVVDGALEIEPESVAHVLEVCKLHPLGHGVAEPWILLVAVHAAQERELAVEVEPARGVIPAEPAEAGG